MASLLEYPWVNRTVHQLGMNLADLKVALLVHPTAEKKVCLVHCLGYQKALMWACYLWDHCWDKR